MRIAFISPENWFLELARELSKTHEVLVNSCDKDIDLIFGASITKQDEIWDFHKKFPYIPMANYNWDLYDWQRVTPRPWEYHWGKYGELLRQSKINFASSTCTKNRAKQYYGIDSEVVLTFVPVFDAEVSDRGYIYQPLREQPDKNWGLVESVCEELGLECITHTTPYEKYQEVLAGCNLVISGLYEASTGSLSLVEAAYLGKPCLVIDSPYNGGTEYLSGVPTFKDKEELKEKILSDIKPTPLVHDFSVGRMAKEICESISRHLGK